VASEDPENRAADGAPCADSISTLGEHMKKLDDMELLIGNEGTMAMQVRITWFQNAGKGC
jgi:hypothetical protein